MAMPPPKILELQHLGFRSTLPAPALLPWVQNYWSIAQDFIPREGFAEKIYPDGGSTLYFRFHTHLEQQVNGVLAQALTSGLLSSRHEVFGVRFLPGGAFHLLGLAPVAAGTPPLDQVDLGLPELSTLHEQLAQAQPEQRSALMDQWLLQRAAKLDVHAGLIQSLWPRLLTTDDLSTLYDQAGISRRTFERLFDHEVGLSPGQLRQLQRIRRARYLIKTSPTASLTDIAYACGYFDQAHFNRHFRAMVNETPGQYRQRQLQRLRKGELVLA